jgi:ribosome-associated toxin RatA of RatAB toxin-antitoxin module
MELGFQGSPSPALLAWTLMLVGGWCVGGCAGSQSALPVRDSGAIQPQEQMPSPKQLQDYWHGAKVVAINACPEVVLEALKKPENYREFLPALREFKLRPKASNGDAMADIDQGKKMVHAKYTSRMRSGKSGVRFWVDPEFPHDIKDAFGSFEVRPGTLSLAEVEFKIWLNIGNGFVELFFSGNIHSIAMTIPDRVKAMVESRPQSKQSCFEKKTPPVTQKARNSSEKKKNK